MQYFSYISNTYQCKNNLHKDILAFLFVNNRQIIGKETLEIFKKGILKGINDINKKYPRCTPINAHFYSSGAQMEFDLKLELGSGTICNFHLYQSN